jgi:hypothetical protein
VKLDPAALAVDVLDALVLQIGSANLPVRRYTWWGTLDFDCEAFIVHGMRIFQGRPGAETPEPVREYATWAFEMGVSITRCLPKATSAPRPAAADYNTAGQTGLGDAGTLLRGAVDAREYGHLLTGCDLVTIGPVVPVGPSGGVMATTLTITVGL